MKKFLIKRPLISTLTLSLFLVASLFIGRGTALSSSSPHNTTAMLKLQTIRANYLAARRQEALRSSFTEVSVDAGQPAAWLRKVNPAEICMVTNTHERTPQKGILIDGKTYYGACDGCAENLRLNPSARFARDPYSGKVVDKAEAVPFADASGRVWYFESDNSKAEFIKLAGKPGISIMPE